MINLERFTLINNNINNLEYDIDDIFMDLIIIYDDYLEIIKNEFTNDIKESGRLLFELLRLVYMNDRFNEDIFDEDHEELNKNILNYINNILELFDNETEDDILVSNINNLNNLFNNNSKDKEIDINTLTKVNNSFIINKIYKKIQDQSYPLSEQDIEYYNGSIEYINFVLDNEFDEELVKEVTDNICRKDNIDYKSIVINKINNNDDEDVKENEDLSNKLDIEDYLQLLLKCQSILDQQNHIDI